MVRVNKSEEVTYSYTTDVHGLEEENQFLKESVTNLERELERFKRAPLISCEVREVFEGNALIRLPNGNEFFVEVSSQCKNLKPGDAVLAEQKNLAIVKRISTNKKLDVEKFVIIEKPKIGWENIGGLKEQEKEIKEVVELPLKRPDLFKKVGIRPPKGILLHGPSGTGKTLLAKAVAESTNSTFIQIVGSELVQKFIGEGAKLVKEIFQLARERAPSIIFIDELDAIAATRLDIGTSGEREVQRTFMQLLAEIDGFRPLDDVKVIGCTNRRDILDGAVLRPGRLDRLISVPLPDREGRTEIFRIHTKEMNLKNVDLDRVVDEMKGFSGAEIHAVVTEAGYFAIRSGRTFVQESDILNAIDKIKSAEGSAGDDFLRMFG